MTQVRCALLLILSAIIASCNMGSSGSKSSVVGDTITYSYKTFKQRDTSCGNNPDSACTIVKIEYPDFCDKKALNDSIAQKFIKLYAVTNAKPDTNYKQLAGNFINYYHDFKKIQPKSTLFYLLDGHAKVLRQDTSMVNIEITGYSYHGGPHGVEYTGYVNWDTKANKSISLNDILVSDYQDKLNSIAEQLFRKNEKLSDTSSLNNQRTYFFKNNKFSLPDSYLLTTSGICFLYNVYTIKAYAAGPTQLFIPYAQIEPLLLPGSVVKTYIKK